MANFLALPLDVIRLIYNQLPFDSACRLRRVNKFWFRMGANLKSLAYCQLLSKSSKVPSLSDSNIHYYSRSKPLELVFDPRRQRWLSVVKSRQDNSLHLYLHLQGDRPKDVLVTLADVPFVWGGNRVSFLPSVAKCDLIKISLRDSTNDPQGAPVLYIDFRQDPENPKLSLFFTLMEAVSFEASLYYEKEIELKWNRIAVVSNNHNSFHMWRNRFVILQQTGGTNVWQIEKDGTFHQVYRLSACFQHRLHNHQSAAHGQWVQLDPSVIMFGARTLTFLDLNSLTHSNWSYWTDNVLPTPSSPNRPFITDEGMFVLLNPGQNPYELTATLTYMRTGKSLSRQFTMDLPRMEHLAYWQFFVFEETIYALVREKDPFVNFATLYSATGNRTADVVMTTVKVQKQVDVPTTSSVSENSSTCQIS